MVLKCTVPYTCLSGCQRATYLGGRGNVDGIGRSTRCGEGSLGLGQVAQGMVCPALQQVNVQQQQLVVQPLHLHDTR